MKQEKMKIGYQKYIEYKDGFISVNPHIVSQDICHYLDRIIENSTKQIFTKEEFYRARTHKIEYSPDGMNCGRPSYPFGEDAMRTPSNEIPVSEGRANPKNVRYFYVASNEITACAEVRPFCGQWISMATFRPKKKLKIISLTHISSWCSNTETGDEEEIRCFKLHLSNHFRLPVNTDDNHDLYLSTQYFTSYVKAKGYDGIEFVSSLMNRGIKSDNNRCYVFFDDSQFVYMNTNLKHIDEIRFADSPTK